MPDKFSKEVRSAIMSRIRSKNTGIEMLVFRELRRRGIRFQKHYRRVVGTPDVAVPKRKIAVFVDGDFWHGFRYPAWKRKLSSKFWTAKIERNRRRDRRNFAKLRREGWRVMRVWEHQLKKKNQAEAFDRIADFIEVRLR
jgi:DNA mismatch endonuclease (patch repair protein)